MRVRATSTPRLGNSYETATDRLADREDLRLRFDVLTKTRQPELHRYWTTRRLFRLAAEVLQAVEAGVFPPRPGWQCGGVPVSEPVLGVWR